MTVHPTPIWADLWARSVDPEDFARPVRLFYDPANPLEVRAEFLQDLEFGKPVVWLWSRDVMAAAIVGTGEMGQLDVQMWPYHDEIMVRLADTRSLEPEFMILALSRSAVKRFLKEAARLVPYGSEGDLVDLDTEWSEFNRNRRRP